MERNISERMGELIKALGMTKNSFAISIGKTSSAINFIVDGKSKPSYEVLDAICEKYKEINPSWLLTGEGEMMKTSEPAKKEDSYLQEHLTKLESQFERLLTQLEVKDRHIEKLMDLLGKPSPAIVEREVKPMWDLQAVA